MPYDPLLSLFILGLRSSHLDSSSPVNLAPILFSHVSIMLRTPSSAFWLKILYFLFFVFFESQPWNQPSIIFRGDLVRCSGEWYLEAKIWKMGMPIAVGVWLLSGPHSGQSSAVDTCIPKFPSIFH